MLRLIKLIHTLVWLVMVSAIFYGLYAGWHGIFDRWFYLCVVLVTFESVVLLVNKWVCPLTPLAARFTDNPVGNFDIYLPRLLAKYNKLIFSTILVVGIIAILIKHLLLT